MRGQADSIGLSFEEIVTLKCMNELTFYYQNIAALCTTLAATGKATEGGKTFMGQNIDWSPAATIDLLKIHHSDGPVQFILSFSNSTEYTLSSAGFGICALATIGMDYAFNLPLACYLPKVMRQNNIHEAMELLKQVAHGLGYYQLAGAKGEIYGIESISNDFEILRPENDMLLHSNHYITERFKHLDAAPQYIPDSYPRLERITLLANQQFGKLNPGIAMEILADHDSPLKSICQHLDPAGPSPSLTLASFIMIPEEGTIYIAGGNPCEFEYIRYEL